MGGIRTFAKIIAGLWLVFVLVMAIGGTWLTRNGLGFGEDIAASQERRVAAREQRAESRRLAADGWGTSDSGSSDSNDWGSSY